MKKITYQETGRIGRITKHLRKDGFEEEMKEILHDSEHFTKLKKVDQTLYVETVVGRMVESIGKENTERVLFNCGAQCCGKSWSEFAKRIWDSSKSIEDFFIQLNKEEKKYNTQIKYNPDEHSIVVERTQCICGLINKGKPFTSNNDYCKCSIGHMSVFFNTVFSVKNINLEKSIYAGADKCKWLIEINI